MKPKVAFFVINHASIGGVERVTANLMKLFISKGLAVQNLISLGNKNENNIIMDFPQNIEIKYIPRASLTEMLQLYLTKEKITHLIFQGDNMSISLNILEALKPTNSKGILHYHGSPYAYLKKNLYLTDIIENPVNLLKIGFSKWVYPFKKRKLFRAIVGSKHGFVTVSRSVKHELNGLFSTRFNTISCIYNPITLRYENQISMEDKLPTIVFISRLERKHKNAFLSIRAWQLIHAKYPNWTLQILGNGSLMERMKNFKEKHQINNLCLKGEVKYVDDYLQKSSISISTSDTEGFGLGLFEATAYKNAIVTTNSYGGVKDFVKEGFNGFFVDKNDCIGMAKKIEELILNKSLREEMGKNSYKKFKEISEKDIFSRWSKLL